MELAPESTEYGSMCDSVDPWKKRDMAAIVCGDGFGIDNRIDS